MNNKADKPVVVNIDYTDASVYQIKNVPEYTITSPIDAAVAIFDCYNTQASWYSEYPASYTNHAYVGTYQVVLPVVENANLMRESFTNGNIYFNKISSNEYTARFVAKSDSSYSSESKYYQWNTRYKLTCVFL